MSSTPSRAASRQNAPPTWRRRLQGSGSSTAQGPGRPRSARRRRASRRSPCGCRGRRRRTARTRVPTCLDARAGCRHVLRADRRKRRGRVRRALGPRRDRDDAGRPLPLRALRGGRKAVRVGGRGPRHGHEDADAGRSGGRPRAHDGVGGRARGARGRALRARGRDDVGRARRAHDLRTRGRERGRARGQAGVLVGALALPGGQQPLSGRRTTGTPAASAAPFIERLAMFAGLACHVAQGLCSPDSVQKNCRFSPMLGRRAGGQPGYLPRVCPRRRDRTVPARRILLAPGVSGCRAYERRVQ